MIGLGLSIPQLAAKLGNGGFGVGSSLNLDFTSGNQTLDPRITFSRASNATVTGPDGTLQYAPHNLLTFSEQFDNAAWAKTNVTVVANAAVAPDGTTTADELTATAADCTIGRYGTATTAGVLHTGSIYLRANTPTSVRIFLVDAGGGSGADFTVCNVTTTWQRFTVQRTTSAGTTAIGFQIGGASTFSTGEVIQAWGAQLNVGSLQPYYTTTVKNLLGFTQEFDNAAWTKTELTISGNQTVAPDGTLTADQVVESATASATHVLFQNAGSSATHTLSVYVKANGRSWVNLRISGTSNYFNISTGVLGTIAVGNTAAITFVGSGWYKCSVTATMTSSGAVGVRLSIADGNDIYTGDGTSGIYIWGAQLSDSASLDPYVYNPGAAPTAAAYYGPRFDYDPVTLAPRGLLIEEQRTNSIRNNTMQGAVAGTPGTLPTNWANLFNTTTGVSREIVGAGFEDGISYIDVKFSGTAVGAGSFDLLFETANGVPALTGQTWSLGFFWKLVSGTTAGFSSPIRYFYEYTSTQGFVAAQNVGALSFPSGLPLREQRVIGSATLSGGATTAFVRPLIKVNIANGAAIDITLRIGMPQLEQGAFATSVIPTTTAAATRAADVAVMTGANFSNWYRQDEGTLFAEAAFLAGVAAQSFTAQIAGDSSNYIAMYRDSSNQRLTGRIRSGAVDQAFMYATASSVIGGAQYKQALAYKVDDFATAANGASALTDTSGTVPTSMTTLGIGGAIYTSSVQLNGHIRKIAYFPRRLSNAELQGITS